MNEITEIITAPFMETTRLLNNDYVCVSIIGKVYGEYERIEEIQRVTSLNTFRHYYHLKAKDYYACYLLYKDILERKGIERLKTDLINLAVTNNKSKIALLGYGIGDEFCYRHILSDFLTSNGVFTTELTKVDLNVQKAHWSYNIYKDRGHDNLTDEFVGKTLENCNWIFAKTMLKNPHWYTLRSDFGNNEVYLSIVRHIRYFGKDEIFQGILYRVFYVGSYKYWTMPEDLTNESCDLINRKP
nr:hypothetical protein [uncultured Psychroserpens sp.]